MEDELAFIKRLRGKERDVPPGEHWIGDDAAVLDGGLLFATDVLVEGVHFDLEWCSGGDVGWKALAVNLSDLAAMGGTPRAAVVAMVVPGGRPALADEIAAGLGEASTRFGCPIVGGDTSAGDALVVTVSVLGAAPGSGAVLRSGAKNGDAIFVTGELGGAAAALRLLQETEARDVAVAEPIGLERLRRPTPRLSEGRAAAGAGATAMIDLSDGLSGDLAHICEESGVGAVIRASAVPTAPTATLADIFGGGDDYELCFAAPDESSVNEAFARAGLDAPVCIGHVTHAQRLLVEDHGIAGPMPEAGWRHRFC